MTIKIANKLDQGSRDWLTDRARGIGASETSILLGLSPWNTKFQLWMQKTGLGFSPSPNQFALRAMIRGNLAEPHGRKLFEAKMGCKFDPINLVHEELPYVKASLDGYNAEKKAILELKAPGKTGLADARKGKIPKYYYPQIQQQLLLAKADVCYYVVYDGESEIIVQEVKPDKAYQDMLIVEIKKFWKLVEAKTPPKLSVKDLEMVNKQIVAQMTELQKATQALSVLTNAMLLGSVDESTKEE